MINFKEIMSYEILELAGAPITVAALLTALVIIGLTFVVKAVLKRWIRLGFEARKITDEGTIGLVSNLVGYVILAVGIGSALSTVGINLSALFAAGAVFAVGIGFAMQTIMQNFVSGIILMLERSIKRGDILDVDGDLVRVVRMGVRSTAARCRDGEVVLIPNSLLVQAKVFNRSQMGSQFRVSAKVGVAYESDLDVVFRTLERVGEELDMGVRKPQIILEEFGASSVNFELAVWTDDPWQERVFRSAMNKALWDAFKEAEITISFPQLDVHVKAPDPVTIKKAS